MSIPFLQTGHMCTCVGIGGGEGQVKGNGSVHLEKIKEVKSKMMTAGCNDAPRT